MIYGIDLDGCCYDFITCFSEWLKNATGARYNYEDITDYYWYKCIDSISEEAFFREFDKFGYADMYRWLPLLDGAKDAINKLKQHGDDVVFVTGRPAYAKKTTEYVLARDFGLYNKLYFSHGTDYKADAINELGIDIFVEDGPHYAMSIAENTNAKVLLMDIPYNRNIKHEKITRVYSWADILREAI